MYSNIGVRIKTLAKFFTWIGIIGSVIACVFFFFQAGQFKEPYLFITGTIVLVVGSLISWISSWLLYGFGELIDQTTKIANNTLPVYNYSMPQEDTNDSYYQGTNINDDKVLGDYYIPPESANRRFKHKTDPNSNSWNG